jgi:PAS domain S-box-containing protein
MISYDEQFLERVFDSVTDPFTIYDCDFRILRANKALATLFNLSIHQIVGEYCYGVLYNRTSICPECHVEKTFLTGEPQMIEKKIPIPDGGHGVFEIHSYPIKDETGRTIQTVEYIRDITERKSLESQLLASKIFNEKIVDSITDNLIVIDPRTLRIIQANKSFCARVGSALYRITQKKCYEIMRNSALPCEENGIECPVQQTIRSKVSSVSERIYPDSSGQDKVLQITTYPILDEADEIVSVIRLERDVTERRKMEDALAFRSKELQRAQHQLEKLFEISRQVNAKNSLSEIVDYVHEIAGDIFIDSDPILFLLDAGGQNFLTLEGCNTAVPELLGKIKQELENAGLVPDFVRYLQHIEETRIIGSEYDKDLPVFFSFILRNYSNWFGLPISTPQQCIGYFVLASPTPQDYSREDTHFFLALFNQISGHIRHLVIHETEIDHLRLRVAQRTSHGKIVGQSDEMQKIYELIDLVAGSDVTVLITGENGTGKELVAQAIHRQSHRRKGPLVVANCSAYSPALLESELFGHEKGAFTGAIKMKKGRIERAQGGILFLDEIGDIAPATQVLLLRFLQDHCFERVGGEETLEADVRVLAATNRDLFKEVEAGRFRDDLYYRLNVITIHVPPLRNRKEDIPWLCSHFLESYKIKEGKNIFGFSPGAMQTLMDYDWPGNVRQLENAVSHAIILTQGQEIERRHLPQFLKESVPEPSTNSLAENERRLILGVLKESKWNKHEAARRLEISRSTLYSKIRRYRLANRIPIED